MLRFVLGRSGYGKTEYLRRHFAELAKNGDDKLLFIVPDQISFETEEAFLDLLGPSVSRRISVLGFSRLCDYVFEATGNRFATFADEGVRHMIMSLAVEQVRDGLTVFDKGDSAGTRELLLNAVKEYKKCAIGSAELLDAAEKCGDDTLSAKLRDTALVYDAYDAIMAQSYMDPLDSLTKVRDLLCDNRLFDGYTVALDAFYGFTSQEYEVIEQLAVEARHQGRDTTVATSDRTVRATIGGVPVKSLSSSLIAHEFELVDRDVATAVADRANHHTTLGDRLSDEMRAKLERLRRG